MNASKPISHVTHDGKEIAGIGTFVVAIGAAIELNNTGTFLMMKRADEYQKGVWEFVYGRVDQHEDFETGLRREVREETGISDLAVGDHFSTWHIYRGKKSAETEVMGVSFICRTSQETPKLSTEHSEYAWVTPEEAIKRSTVDGITVDCKKLQKYLEQQKVAVQAQAQAARALADYQNLVRRQHDDRQKLIRLATMDFANSIIEPLEHLRMAARQLDDSGLNMVLTQLFDRLKEQGLEPIDPIGQPFDVETMEAVEQAGKSATVSSVIKLGWKLNGVVIQHAKVSLQ